MVVVGTAVGAAVVVAAVVDGAAVVGGKAVAVGREVAGTEVAVGSPQAANIGINKTSIIPNKGRFLHIFGLLQIFDG
jgi:hypothetical protein